MSMFTCEKCYGLFDGDYVYCEETEEGLLCEDCIDEEDK